MSQSGSPQNGPIESRIKGLWTEIWKAEENGEVYEGFLSVVEGDIANLISNFPGNNVDPSDLGRANIYHIYQSKHFAVHLTAVANEREAARWSLNLITDQTTTMSQHALRSMTLGHGAIALAVLAFIGNDKDALATTAPIWIIGLSAAGFLLSILGSYIGVSFATRTFRPLVELSHQRLSAKDRQRKGQFMIAQSRRMNWATRPFYYLSLLCLFAAAGFGIAMLSMQHTKNSHAEVSYAHGWAR